MGRTLSVATTSEAVRSSTGNWRRARPWKRHAVEKSNSRLSHPAWKSRKVRGIPTTGMARRLFHWTDYLGGQEEIHHGHLHAWHRPEQNYISRNWIQRRRRDCIAQEVLSQATASFHFEPATDAHRHGVLWGRTLSRSSAKNTRARCQI